MPMAYVISVRHRHHGSSAMMLCFAGNNRKEPYRAIVPPVKCQRVWRQIHISKAFDWVEYTKAQHGTNTSRAVSQTVARR
mmetsp:Transcript_141416/g.200294  ORF Transcript_141416/g.200294 Transcript_141416/m.200294 type:complete len:80 (+) Transcript_141416:261-500(+)